MNLNADICHILAANAKGSVFGTYFRSVKPKSNVAYCLQHWHAALSFVNSASCP